MTIASTKGSKPGLPIGFGITKPRLERKKLPKSHPRYLLLKIIANALYGIFAELNKDEYGKNSAKQLYVFSGEHKFKQPAFAVERPGRFQFPPAAALITAGGRLMLAILEHLAKGLGGT